MTDAFNLGDVLPENEQPEDTPDRDIFADKQGFNESQKPTIDPLHAARQEGFDDAVSQLRNSSAEMLSEQDTRAIAMQILLQNASIRQSGYVNAQELIADADLVTRYLATGHTPVSPAEGSSAPSDPDLG